MKSLIARLPIAVVGGVALFALGPVSPALTASTQVTLHLAGTHPADVDLHKGTFTASPPLCASGSWLGNGEGRRVFTCNDGTGTFTASFAGELEHRTGATGRWTIASGTGNYAALRGKGTATIDFSTGDETTSPITFTDTWSGIVDFDATAPTGSITEAKVVRSLHGRWSVKVSFRARDNEKSSPVTFRAITTAGGSYVAGRTGTITAETGSFTFTVAFRPGKRIRLLRIEIELTDQWGNLTTIKRSVRLR
ncbi:MAG: hypothetical protein M3R57_06820 [Chloroflexota bacterium]|nr:hypothetical protein [Chloroflexota bacterium]